MAKMVFQCETSGCTNRVANPHIELCDGCATTQGLLRPCAVCKTMFNPKNHYEPDGVTVICCADQVRSDFYLGEPLTDPALDWVITAISYTAVKQRAVKQRAVAVALREAGGGLSIRDEVTYWRTPDGTRIEVKYQSPCSITQEPVVSIKIGREYCDRGITGDQITAILAAITKETT